MTPGPPEQARLETLLSTLLAGERRPVAEELVRELTGLYAEGLTRIVALLRENAPGLVEAVAADDVVADLLVLHDLHPLDTDARIRRALGGSAEYLGTEAGVARVRLGASGGCSAASERAVEAVVRAAAPEVAGVEVGTEVRLYRIGMGPPGDATPEGRAS
ncbi:NifU family protein [Amycolatopsis sp. OK19-0408]|uniref:NifU family protein n=1 Tax=Amycolatopsis iheyensis TaxID=2945988 RepID=A0A9X2SLQ7_9PSEU|nr:NifU family protein [Amycolatopsis iheyensis]MCR6485111.1 NifU family protein [Amycolatopsis iheyensis]